MKYFQIKKAIKEAEKIDCKGYEFNKYSFGEEGTYIPYELIKEVKQGLLKLYKIFSPDYLVSTEPGSHTWGLLLASEVKKPLNIIRTINPKMPTNQAIYKQRTGYCVRNLSFQNFKSKDSVLIVEDVIGTGSTLELIVDTLTKMNVKVQGVITILRKGLDKLDSKYNFPIISLIDK